MSHICQTSHKKAKWAIFAEYAAPVQMKRKSNDISLFNDNANKSMVTQMAALAESAATHDAMYVCAE